MAARSGSNTGLIVALIVFIVMTIGLLTMTIIFYTGQTTAQEDRLAAENRLSEFISRDQQSHDAVQALLGEARGQGQSLYRYLQDELSDLRNYTVGNANARLEEVRQSFAAYDVPEDGPLAASVQNMNRQLRLRNDEIASLESSIQRRDEELAELEQQLAQAEENHQETIAALEQSIGAYRRESEQMYEDVRVTKDEMRQILSEQSNDHALEVRGLEDQIDTISQENVVLKDRLRELENVVEGYRPRAQNPAQLAAGEVIDVSGTDEVFINLGARDRIVMGMTFEVFDTPSAIGNIDRTGRMPRGKASIEVVRVGDRTSTAKITRSTPGRPVVRNDVIANAVYDRNYRFKFLIHGRFDIDGDGRATTEEAEYLRSLVVEWGGQVVEGASIPGDLDFLVLGMEPSPPSPLPARYTNQQFEVYMQQQRVRDEYLRLFNQASEAQIPVLNANRFFILTGLTGR